MAKENGGETKERKCTEGTERNTPPLPGNKFLITSLILDPTAVLSFE